MIERIDSKRRPSEIADDVGIAAFRTSETCDLDWRDPAVAAVDEKIAALLGLPLAVSEPLQGQRYAPGQEFKPHTDTFEPGGTAYFEHCAETGQRTWTAMIYLNRLSDLLFVMGRVANANGTSDVLWTPGKFATGEGRGPRQEKAK